MKTNSGVVLFFIPTLMFFSQVHCFKSPKETNFFLPSNTRRLFAQTGNKLAHHLSRSAPQDSIQDKRVAAQLKFLLTYVDHDNETAPLTIQTTDRMNNQIKPPIIDLNINHYIQHDDQLKNSSSSTLQERIRKTRHISSKNSTNEQLYSNNTSSGTGHSCITNTERTIEELEQLARDFDRYILRRKQLTKQTEANFDGTQVNDDNHLINNFISEIRKPGGALTNINVVIDGETIKNETQTDVAQNSTLTSGEKRILFQNYIDNLLTSNVNTFASSSSFIATTAVTPSAVAISKTRTPTESISQIPFRFSPSKTVTIPQIFSTEALNGVNLLTDSKDQHVVSSSYSSYSSHGTYSSYSLYGTPPLPLHSERLIPQDYNWIIIRAAESIAT